MFITVQCCNATKKLAVLINSDEDRSIEEINKELYPETTAILHQKISSCDTAKLLDVFSRSSEDALEDVGEFLTSIFEMAYSIKFKK